MAALVMEFRRRAGRDRGDNIWHWCRGCRFLPETGDGVEVRRLEPGDVPEKGDLCGECAALGESMGCGLILLEE